MRTATSGWCATRWSTASGGTMCTLWLPLGYGGSFLLGLGGSFPLGPKHGWWGYEWFFTIFGLILIFSTFFKTFPQTPLASPCYQRMLILKKLYKFSVPVEDLVHIYCMYIRSVAEQSSVVWSSSLTRGEEYDLERIQKFVLRIICDEAYESYEWALHTTNLSSLKSRGQVSKASLYLSIASVLAPDK